MVRTVNVPRNVDVNTNLAIVVLPKASLVDPLLPSATELQAAQDVTYSHTTDGLNATSTQETITDPRLSLENVPESPGNVTNSLEVTYFYGDEELALDPLLVKDAELYVVVRDTVDVTEDFAAAQKVDVYSITVGAPRKNRETNGKQTKTTKLFVQQKWVDVAVSAAA